MNTILDREPVMFMAVIQAGIALAVSFGLNLDGMQTGAIMAFSAAVLGLFARSRVTPV